MRQKREENYPEVISMEEYLTKRKKVRENEQNKRWGGIAKEDHAMVLAEVYV